MFLKKKTTTPTTQSKADKKLSRCNVSLLTFNNHDGFKYSFSVLILKLFIRNSHSKWPRKKKKNIDTNHCNFRMTKFRI